MVIFLLDLPMIVGTPSVLRNMVPLSPPKLVSGWCFQCTMSVLETWAKLRFLVTPLRTVI